MRRIRVFVDVAGFGGTESRVGTQRKQGVRSVLLGVEFGESGDLAGVELEGRFVLTGREMARVEEAVVRCLGVKEGGVLDGLSLMRFAIGAGCFVG